MNKEKKSKLNIFKEGGGWLSSLIMLILLWIIFAIGSEFFLTFRNIMNIGSYMSIMGTMAAGLTVAMLLAGLDVSQYSLAALAGMVLGICFEAGISPWLTLLIVLAVGILGGSFNAFIITVMGVNPIICTMGTSFIFRGIAYLTTDGRYIRIKDDVYYFIGKGKLAGIPFCLIIMLITYVVIWFVLKYTVYGRSVFAVGGNMQVARLAGINVKKIRFISHILAGITAVMGGVITVCQASSCMASQGYGNDMNGISAVILGGISMAGGRGNVFGTLIGVAILSTLVNGMTLLNVNSYWQQIIQGLLLVFAVFIDAVRSSKRGN